MMMMKYVVENAVGATTMTAMEKSVLNVIIYSFKRMDGISAQIAIGPNWTIKVTGAKKNGNVIGIHKDP